MTTLEYALMLALVALTSLASYQILGRDTAASTQNSTGEITTATQPASTATDNEGGAPAAPVGG